MLVNQTEYAKRRGVSKMAVSKAVASGRIKMTNGKIDSIDADRDWENNTRVNMQEHQRGSNTPDDVDINQNGPTKGSLAHAQLVHETAKARKAQLEAQRMEGKYAELAAVAQSVGDMVVAAKSILRRIGNKLAPHLAIETNPVICEALIESEVDEALHELSRWEPESA